MAYIGKVVLEGQTIRGNIVATSATHYEIKDAKTGYVFGVPQSEVTVAGKAEPTAKKAKATTIARPTKKTAKKVKVGGRTKADIVLEIVRTTNLEGMALVSHVCNEAGMTTAGARTYIYNARKKLGAR